MLRLLVLLSATSVGCARDQLEPASCTPLEESADRAALRTRTGAARQRLFYTREIAISFRERQQLWEQVLRALESARPAGADLTTVRIEDASVVVSGTGGAVELWRTLYAAPWCLNPSSRAVPPGAAFAFGFIVDSDALDAAFPPPPPSRGIPGPLADPLDGDRRVSPFRLRAQLEEAERGLAAFPPGTWERLDPAAFRAAVQDLARGVEVAVLVIEVDRPTRKEFYDERGWKVSLTGSWKATGNFIRQLCDLPGFPNPERMDLRLLDPSSQSYEATLELRTVELLRL